LPSVCGWTQETDHTAVKGYTPRIKVAKEDRDSITVTLWAGHIVFDRRVASQKRHPGVRFAVHKMRQLRGEMELNF